MFRLSRITDYGIVLLAHLARVSSQGTSRSVDDPGRPAARNARELAAEVDLPLPIVSKILKSLARSGLLESHRGTKGGYVLARRPENLTVAQMIAALDGPLALTQCVTGPEACNLESTCAVRSPWQVINQVVQYSLSDVSLADLIDPSFAAQYARLATLGTSLPRSEAESQTDQASEIDGQQAARSTEPSPAPLTARSTR